MPDLDTVLDELGQLPDRAPATPAPVAEVAARAADRRRRRYRLQAGLAAAVVTLVVAASALATLPERDAADVRTVDRPDEVSTPAPAPTPPTTAPAELQVVPDTGLVDGDVVTVTGPFDPSTLIGVAQCGSEVWDADGDVLPWCDINVSRAEGPVGSGELRVTVRRTIQTSNGFIDCAERPKRCLVGVRTSAGSDVVAPISFRSDLGPEPTPEITLDHSTVGDGEVVTVVGSGFDQGMEVYASQCVGRPDDPELSGVTSYERCGERSAGYGVADPEGRVDLRLRVFADLLLPSEGWTRCEPCTVLVWSTGRRPSAVPLAISLTRDPIRPTVRIVPDGPYRPGQRVRLEGSGFGIDDSGHLLPSITWCGFRSDAPETEGQDRGATCAYPSEGAEVHVQGDGTFVLDDFPLPDGLFEPGVDCFDPAIRCGLAWHPMVGSLPVFVTLFELQP